MKYQVNRILATGLVLFSTAMPMTMLQPALAAALSTGTVAVVAAPGNSCSLPDGSTDGVIEKDGNTCCPKKYANNPNPIYCLYAKYINPTISLLSALVGVVVIIAIIYGAIEYTTSGGDPQRIASGKKRIIEALIGLVAFMLLYSLLQFLVPGGLFSQ